MSKTFIVLPQFVSSDCVTENSSCVILTESFTGHIVCRIMETKGFLKNVCRVRNSPKKWFKCATSSHYYTIKSYYDEYHNEPLDLSAPCPADEHFYQLCGLISGGKVEITNGQLLCGGFTCTRHHDDPVATVKLLSEINKSTLCSRSNGVRQPCYNTVVDEELCAELREAPQLTTMPSGKVMETSFLCDDTCQDGDYVCEDEANCNGFQYGIYCINRLHPLKRLEYLPATDICDGFQVCQDGEDEENCKTDDDIAEQESCLRNEQISTKPETVPLKNRTRCILYEPYNRLGFPYTYCQNAMDQTNCSDPARVGVTCKINNFTSTVSKYMVCARGPPLCDDRIENICPSVSVSCNLHKHRLCDGVNDCPDKSDENIPYCSSMTEDTCIRTAQNDATPRTIPLAWLQDGVVDCMDERDEMSIWPTCGVHDTKRFVADRSSKSCENVLMCPNTGFVQYEDLCDGFESCGIENRVCKVSRGYADIQTTPSFISASKRSLTIKLSYCLQGVRDIPFLPNGNCHIVHYRYINEEIFGVPKKNTIHIPSIPRNCDHLYGENYVWTSCTGNCLASTCPLKTAPRFEHCLGQIPNRVGTLVGNSYLTFLTKLNGVYHNNFFICAISKKCVEYSKVCDLVEDCADGSDEAECTNHFKCGETDHYIPITQKCDGTVNCLDSSDECNESCSKRILSNKFLSAASCFIGAVAILGNVIVILSELRQVKQCNTIDGLANKSFVILVALGDLMIGIYLVWVFIADSLVYGSSYCRAQWSWLTSPNCTILGVLSTAGTQISLFSMCTLSIFRATRFRDGIRVSNEVTTVSAIKLVILSVLVLTTAFTIAIVPLIPYLEDFFVNGLYYDPRMKLFIRSPDKEQHFHILQEYYGRMKRTPLSWKQINKMVSSMFSQDLNYEDLTRSKKKLGFYGNDPVCLFKYFIRSHEPQTFYVWYMLSMNIACFVIIAVCYVYINLASYNSALAAGGNKEIQERLQRKIALIIITDFSCWIPFLTVCVLHSLEVLDGTKWYSFFSMVMLPINSVINPLLYSETFYPYILKFSQSIGKLTSYLKTSEGVAESIEMQPNNAPSAMNLEEQSRGCSL